MTSAPEVTTDGVCEESEFRRGWAMVCCPECEAAIDVEDDIEEGQTVDCPECDARLEVVSTNPLVLDVIPSASEEDEEDEAQTW